MNPALTGMLKEYRFRGVDDYTQALKEIVQQLALLGLWRAKFYEKAAFYGGTALRLLYGLDRFSEDLDFSLLRPEPDFDPAGYTRAVKDELRAFGFEVEVTGKKKTTESRIRSAFIKGNTRQMMVNIDVPREVVLKMHADQKISVRFELDVDPPPGFQCEARTLLRPIPFSVLAYSPPDLLAGKLHAVLCRPWKSRIKGRDFYDLAWFLGRGVGLRVGHLEQRLRQTGDWRGRRQLSIGKVIELLLEKIDETDFSEAAREVRPFLGDPQATAMWSRGFFKSIASERLVAV